MKKHMLSLILLALYAITVLYPFLLTSIWHTMDAKNALFTLHLGFIHWPSVLFIFASAFLLHYSVQSKTNDAAHTHIASRKNLNEAMQNLSLENENYANSLMTSTNPYCTDIRTILIKGGIEDDMELVVQKRILEISSSYEKLISEYGYIATVLPMLGMVGTISGLLQMFAITGGVDNFAEKLAGLSVALATTLYATLWVVFVTKPKAREIENWLIELDDDERRLIIHAKLFLHNVDFFTLNEDKLESDKVSEVSMLDNDSEERH